MSSIKVKTQHGYPTCAARRVSVLGVVSRLESVESPAGGDGPDGFDLVAAHADDPVVEVHGWIAMTRNEPDLVAHRELRSLRQFQHALLVGGLKEFSAVLVGHQRHAGIHRQGFQSGVHYGTFGGRMAHDRGPDG